jgi:hypothetical protein
MRFTVNDACDFYALMERHRLAVAAHREAVAGITYKVSQSPSFGELSENCLERYERTRIELLEVETELSNCRRK